MTKIVRYGGNLQAFASAAPGTERTIFGDVAQSNDLTSQISADFLRGWGIVGPSDQPALEDFNGAMYTHGQLLAYLHQIGVPEYNALQEYHIGSVANSGGSLYVSLTDSNVGNTPGSSMVNWRNLDVAPATIASAVNTKANIITASASATFTSDEVVLKSVLGGNSYSIPSISKTINISTVGVGGMDTGSPPAAGFVAIYLIYNPLLAISATNPALLASNATSSAATEYYSGANMPSGYSASALIAVWPTSASLLIAASMNGRRVVRLPTSIINTSSIQATLAALVISSAVPLNAKRVKVLMAAFNTTANTVQTVDLATTIAGSGQQSMTTGIVLAGNGNQCPGEVEITTPQTIFYRNINSGGGTPTFNASVVGYEF